VSKDAHTVGRQAADDVTHGTEDAGAAETSSAGGALRRALVATGPATKLAAAAGVAAVAAGGALAAGDERLAETDEPGDLGDRAAETLLGTVPALEALEDLLPDPPQAESDTADSTAGDTDRPHFEVVEPPVATTPGGREAAGTAPMRRRAVGAVAVASDDDGPARRPIEDRGSPRRPARTQDPAEEPSTEREAGPTSGVLGAPEASGGPEKPAPGDPAADVGSGIESPADTRAPSAPEPEAGATPDPRAPGATPDTPDPNPAAPSAPEPPESPGAASESGAGAP